MKQAEIQLRVSRNRWAIALFLVGMVLIFAGAAPQVRASSGSQSHTQRSQAIPTSASGVQYGPAMNRVNAPLPQATSQANPVDTSQPQPVATGATGGTNQKPTDVTGTAASSGGSFPWLIVIGVILLAIAGLGFAFLRPRGSAATATTVPGRAAPADRADRAQTTTTTTESTARATAPTVPMSPPVAAAGVAAAPAAPAPATVTCPNCGTVNTTDEKFCHECGQDLRPLIAQATATAGAAPPVDVVEEDTPYLETLDRVDEQLEYVLSRPRIGIGTAQGNDIVIDSSFKGWQTVSPRHAELHREQDGFVLVDKDSQNGTFVNEMRTGENILSDGDLVRLGDVRFIFRVPVAGQ